MAWDDYLNPDLGSYYDNSGGGDPGAYWSDVNGGWDYVPPDPDPGGNTSYGYSSSASDPGFMDPTGGWVANPGYDPSTINNLPNIQNDPNADPNLYPGYQNVNGYDPTGGSGVPGDAYNLGPNNPVFTTTGGATMPSDAGSPQIPNPPDPGNGGAYPPYPFPPPTPKPYPPPGTMTQGTQRQSTQQQNKTEPATRPQPPTPQPPSPAPGVGLGAVPGITGALPQDQKFTYNPISISRQSAPNANGQAPYDYQGQGALSKLAGYAGIPTSAGQVPQALGVPTSLTQLRQQFGLTKAGLPFGQSQNPYDNGV